MVGLNKCIRSSLLFLLCMTFGFPVFAQEGSGITTRDIQNLHLYGAQMALKGERELRPIPSADEITAEDFANVEILDLSGVDVFELPEWFSNLPNLRKLVLANTKLELISLDTINTITSLEVLDISGNVFVFPESQDMTLLNRISGLSRLRELNISGTGISEENLGSFEQLSILVILNASRNKITSLSGLGLSGINGLQTLDLASNNLSNILAGELPNQSLVHLDLSQNQLTDLAYMDMLELKYFDISENSNLVLNPKYGSIFGLPSLETFRVDLSETVPDSIVCRLQRLSGNDCRNRNGPLNAAFIEPEMVSVRVSGHDQFEVSAYETTVGEWNLCVQAGACDVLTYDVPNTYPVSGVSISNIFTYIGWLNANSGKTYKLPTLQEMQLAVAESRNDYLPLNDFAWSFYNSNRGLKPVGLKEPNNWGIFDIYGNVAELVVGNEACTQDMLSNFFTRYNRNAVVESCYSLSGGSIFSKSETLEVVYALVFQNDGSRYSRYQVRDLSLGTNLTTNETDTKAYGAIIRRMPFGFRLVLENKSSSL